MAKFNVAYETITPESAKEGDAAERGFLAQGASLSLALAYLQQADVSGHVEANESPITDQVRWVTFYGMHNNIRGTAGELSNYSLHFPDDMKGETRRRLAEFLCSPKAWECIF